MRSAAFGPLFYLASICVADTGRLSAKADTSRFDFDPDTCSDRKTLPQIFDQTHALATDCVGRLDSLITSYTTILDQPILSYNARWALAADDLPQEFLRVRQKFKRRRPDADEEELTRLATQRKSWQYGGFDKSRFKTVKRTVNLANNMLKGRTIVKRANQLPTTCASAPFKKTTLATVADPRRASVLTVSEISTFASYPTRIQ